MIKEFQRINEQQSTKIYNYREKEEWKQFFLGLMDGGGSIQCNHWKKRYIQYRLVIKLKNHPENVRMLKKLGRIIGGSVRSDKNFILWVENAQRRIGKICKIFCRYPPLTSRLQCQLHFFLECRKRQNVQWMLQERQHKYKERDTRIKKMSARNLEKLDYFPQWCSGWIEAEGCFSPGSFSIGQSCDHYLLETVRRYFAGVNKVRQIKTDFYFWQVYRRSCLEKIARHCLVYPLRGEKVLTFSHWLRQL